MPRAISRCQGAHTVSPGCELLGGADFLETEAEWRVPGAGGTGHGELAVSEARVSGEVSGAGAGQW